MIRCRRRLPAAAGAHHLHAGGPHRDGPVATLRTGHGHRPVRRGRRANIACDAGIR